MSGSMHPGTGARPGSGVGDVGLLARAVGGVVDALYEATELVAAAAAGAARGAATAVVEVWVADRPRRQRVRHHRRRRWWRRGGWRRALVAGEVVAIYAALAAVTATRVVLASGQVGAAAGRGARAGWSARRPTTQARTQARRANRWGTPGPTTAGPTASGPTTAGRTTAGPTAAGPTTAGPAASGRSRAGSSPPGWTAGPTSTAGQAEGGSTRVRVEVVDGPVDVVEGEIVCGVLDDQGRGCPTVLAAGQVTCPAHRPARSPGSASTTTAAAGDAGEVVVDAEVVIVGDVVGDVAHGGQERPSRRWDRAAESDRDRRFFDLRASGYQGPVDRDGYAVGDATADGVPPRRLTDEQIAAAVAGGGYHVAPTADRVCCRCVCDPGRPQLDQIAGCRCVVGEGADRASCRCGPWHLATALVEDDLAEELGVLDGDRVTCHQCQDWADHAHDQISGARISLQAYRLQQDLRGPWQVAPAGLGSASPQSPGGRPVAGSAQQHDQQEEQQMGNTVSSAVTATRDGEQVAQVRAGGGATSSTGLGGEITHLDDLDVEARMVEGVIEQAQALAEVLRTWQLRLPEAAAGVLGSTEDIDAAVVAVREATTTGELLDVLQVLRTQIEAATSVGDGLAAAGVTGDLAAITPR